MLEEGGAQLLTVFVHAGDDFDVCQFAEYGPVETGYKACPGSGHVRSAAVVTLWERDLVVVWRPWRKVCTEIFNCALFSSLNCAPDEKSWVGELLEDVSEDGYVGRESLMKEGTRQ